MWSDPEDFLRTSSSLVCNVIPPSKSRLASLVMPTRKHATKKARRKTSSSKVNHSNEDGVRASEKGSYTYACTERPDVKSNGQLWNEESRKEHGTWRGQIRHIAILRSTSSILYPASSIKILLPSSAVKQNVHQLYVSDLSSKNVSLWAKFKDCFIWILITLRPCYYWQWCLSGTAAVSCSTKCDSPALYRPFHLLLWP